MAQGRAMGANRVGREMPYKTTGLQGLGRFTPDYWGAWGIWYGRFAPRPTTLRVGLGATGPCRPLGWMKNEEKCARCVGVV